MIEHLIQKYLASALSVPVWLEVPAKPPDSFILLEKTGSGCTNGIFRATLAVQSYGATLYQAAELNEAVKAAMLEAATLPDLGAIRLNSDYNFTDTSTKRYRYQAVFDLTHY